MRDSPQLLDRVLTRVLKDPTVDITFRSHWLARALEIAIQQNDLALVQQLHRAHPGSLYVQSLQLALHYGSLELVQWVVANRADRRCCAPGLERLCLACLTKAVPSDFSQEDPLDIIRWLTEAGIDVSTLYWTARHASVVRWLDEHYALEASIASDVLLGRIESGPVESFDAVRYLISTDITISEENVIWSLIRGASQRQLEPLIDVVVASRLCDPFRDQFVWEATRPDGPKVLQWDVTYLAETGLRRSMPMPDRIGWYVAHACHVDTAKWLWHTHGFMPGNVPFRSPHSEADLLSFYQWMADNSIDAWSSDDSACAARNGYLSVIQWLHKHKPDQFTIWTMDAAAQNGHLHVVQWLHENRSEGCTENALSLAAQNGHLKVVQWLTANRTERDTNKAMIQAALGGQLEVLAWLHTNHYDGCNQCVLKSVLNSMDSTKGALDTLRWLSLRSAEAGSCRSRCVTQQQSSISLPTFALVHGELDFVRYIFEHHRLVFAVDRIDLVVAGGHLPAVQWLYETAPETVDWQRALEAARASDVDHVAAWLESVVVAAQEE